MEQHAVSTLVGEGLEGAVSDSRLYHEGGDRDAGLALVARRSSLVFKSSILLKRKAKDMQLSRRGEEERREEDRPPVVPAANAYRQPRPQPHRRLLWPYKTVVVGGICC